MAVRTIKVDQNKTCGLGHWLSVPVSLTDDNEQSVKLLVIVVRGTSAWDAGFRAVVAHDAPNSAPNLQIV